MKKVLFIIIVLSFLFTSCRYVSQYHKEKALIENIINKDCYYCNWKVESITDTIGYSIFPYIQSIKLDAAMNDLKSFEKDINICHEQINNWTESKGGIERRLLIAHCVSESGNKLDFYIFNEIKGQRSIRYYDAMDEVREFLDVAFIYF